MAGPHQAQELQITTLANPSKQANLLSNLVAEAHFSCSEIRVDDEQSLWSS